MKWAVLAIVGGVLLLAAGTAAAIMKLSWYRIDSGSMAPAYPVGTIVVDSGAGGFIPHQAITFEAGGALVTHVFLGYNPDGSLITRGLANPTNDAWGLPVYPRDVRGRVVFQVRLLAPAFWTSLSGLATAGGALGLAVAVWLWRRFTRASPAFAQ